MEQHKIDIKRKLFVEAVLSRDYSMRSISTCVNILLSLDNPSMETIISVIAEYTLSNNFTKDMVTTTVQLATFIHDNRAIPIPNIDSVTRITNEYIRILGNDIQLINTLKSINPNTTDVWRWLTTYALNTFSLGIQNESKVDKRLTRLLSNKHNISSIILRAHIFSIPALVIISSYVYNTKYLHIAQYSLILSSRVKQATEALSLVNNYTDPNGSMNLLLKERGLLPEYKLHQCSVTKRKPKVITDDLANALMSHILSFDAVSVNSSIVERVYVDLCRLNNKSTEEVIRANTFLSRNVNALDSLIRICYVAMFGVHDPNFSKTIYDRRWLYSLMDKKPITEERLLFFNITMLIRAYLSNAVIF